MRTKLAAGFFLAQSADAASTYIALNDYGFKEMNPIADYLIRELGMETVMIIKLFMALFLIAVYFFVHLKNKHTKRAMEFSLEIGSFATWAVVLLNVFGVLSTHTV